MTTPKWYAIYTRPRWEKRVAERLTARGITAYCPLNRVVRQWHDRKKLVYEPLFNSYVFVHIKQKEQLNVLQTTGVLNFVYWLGKPAIIRDSEIEQIREFLNEHVNVNVETADFQVGDEVFISKGPLLSQKGKIVQIGKRTVKLYIPSLQVALYAEVDKKSLTKS